VQIIKLLVNFLHSPVTSTLLGENIFLSTIFSNTLSLRSSLNVSDQVSNPYKTAGIIIVMYILICKFLDSKLEDKRFWCCSRGSLKPHNERNVANWVTWGTVTVTALCLYRTHSGNYCAWCIVRVLIECKLQVHSRTGHEGPEVGVEIQLPLSLTSALDGVSGQCHAPAAVPPLKIRYPL